MLTFRLSISSQNVKILQWWVHQLSE